MHQKEEPAEFTVSPTFKHLRLLYYGYTCALIVVSLAVWWRYDYMEDANAYIHVLFTLLLLFTPYILLVSAKNQSIHFFADRLELKDTSGKFIAAIPYKDIQVGELRGLGVVDSKMHERLFTYIYISDGYTTIKLPTTSLTRKDRVYMQGFIDGRIKKLNI